MADKQGTKGCDAAGRNTARCARYQALGHLDRNKARSIKRNKKHLEKAKLRHSRNSVISEITKREFRFTKNHPGKIYWETVASHGHATPGL